MSDRPRATTVRAKRKRAPRGGRHGLSRPAPQLVREAVEPEDRVPTVAPATRSRRTARFVPSRPVSISRDAEIAYIRADMRRLIIIAGALLVLMVVILVVLER